MDAILLSKLDEHKSFFSLGKEYGFVNDILFKEWKIDRKITIDNKIVYDRLKK
jgi:hypothetical protein